MTCCPHAPSEHRGGRCDGWVTVDGERRRCGCAGVTREPMQNNCVCGRFVAYTFYDANNLYCSLACALESRAALAVVDDTTEPAEPERFKTQTILASDENKTRGIYGNCLQASVASVLDMPLEAVPNFALFQWWPQALQLWARGLDLAVRTEKTETIPERVCVVGGKSPRSGTHAVVGGEGRILWDPHPSRDGLASIIDVTWFEPIGPDDYQCLFFERRCDAPLAADRIDALRAPVPPTKTTCQECGHARHSGRCEVCHDCNQPLNLADLAGSLGQQHQVTVNAADLLHWADYLRVGSHATGDNPCEKCDRVCAALKEAERA